MKVLHLFSNIVMRYWTYDYFDRVKSAMKSDSLLLIVNVNIEFKQEKQIDMVTTDSSLIMPLDI